MSPFHWSKFKNIFRANLEFWGCVIFGSEMTNLPWTNLFWYKPLLLPSATYWHFLMCKIFLKNLTAAPESWGHTIFESTMVPLPQTIFLWKNYEHYFHTPTGPFYCEKFWKNSCSGSRVMRMHHFLGHKWLICNNETFFSFIHACLRAKYQSQMMIY